jgi:signal transduction histidine kinase
MFPFQLGKSFISVIDINGRVVAHSQNSMNLALIQSDEATLFKVLKKGSSYSLVFDKDGTKYRAINYLLPVLKIDSPLILQILVPTSSIDISNFKLKEFLITSMALILVFSIIIGYAFTSSALTPMIEITEKTKQIEIRSLKERVPVPESRDEISDLANTINHLLERLHRSFETQERFVQDASHQLKTPLAIIKGELDLFKTKVRDPSEINQFISSMSQELDALVKLTNDLLIMARVDNGDSNVILKYAQIDEVLLNQVSRLSKLAMSKNISIKINLDSFDGVDELKLRVLVDQDLIGILFYNFIENAIKYSPNDSEIEIVGSIESEFILIEVRDHGTGIKDGQEEAIFERFFRSENVHGTLGSGLGLAICKAVAKIHQAEIGAKKNSEIGSIFYIKIKNHQEVV